jgi:DNA polymerase elongation subunit (family B)
MMNQYYKSKNLKNFHDIEFQIIEWDHRDEFSNDLELENENESCEDVYTIRCFGVMKDGTSVTCKINNFTPFYYIKVQKDFNKIKLHKLLDYIESSFQMKKKIDDTWVSYYKSCLIRDKCTIVKKKDIYGFRNNEKYNFVRLVFNNYTAMNKSKYIFKKSLIIDQVNKNPMKYKLYESNFDPFMRFCHIQDILMAGWVRLKKEHYKYTNGLATTQIEVEIDWKKIEPIKEDNLPKQDIANFLQASWDIETYSFDNNFPDPNKKDTKIKSPALIESKYPNVIYQIATTFKYYKDSKTLVKNLLTLKKCDKIEIGEDQVPVVVEEFKTEKELIKRWIDLIHLMDPDIMYTYNGDTFDCMYIYERAKLYNLENYLKSKLSRLTEVETAIKKETFSSSAYGDSDYLRFYIPGRLNYDLLIHYKRGMKKYPSYKLDFIANEILKEGKNDVSAKQIFSFYKEGIPDKIKIIGEYCIQDTELLQKLVDKQLILITIIQLANVTYVPIGFLTTRGQTIKVFSQMLRKARQMDYLVPHTNFNEDTYGILVKTKTPHTFDDDHIGKYIKIQTGRNKTSYGKNVEIDGKISEIIDELNFIILSNIELIIDEQFTAKFDYEYKKFVNVSLTSCDDAIDDSFTGATVLTAQSGLHSDNIAVLDFASLYPTIMISRNLCYSAFIIDPKYRPADLPQEPGIYTINDVKYEVMAWDDKVAYKLQHTCEGKSKTGKNANKICGKQAYFDVNVNAEIESIELEINNLKNNLEELDEIEDKVEYKKLKTKIKTKEKEYTKFKSTIQNQDQTISRYFCRVHDPIKINRDASEKYQKKDISYNYTVVQPSINEHGEKINQGVLPALLEELYAERKKVKKRMAKAYENGDKLLADILNSTQLAIKVSLLKMGDKSKF